MSQVTTRSRPLAESQREQVARLIRTLGERRAGEVLGLRRHTLARAVGGLPIQFATAVLVETRLAAHDERRSA